MRYLTLGEVVALHRAVIESTGGATGLRDLPALESAIAQPRATFDGLIFTRPLPARLPRWRTRSRSTIRSWMATSASPTPPWKYSLP